MLLLLAVCLCRQNLSLISEALVLDMGLYSIPGFAASSAADEAGLLPQLPQLPQPPQPSQLPASQPASSAAGEAGVLTQLPAFQPESRAFTPTGATNAAAAAKAANSSSSSSLQKIQEGNGSAKQQAAAAATLTGITSGSRQGRCGSLRLYQVLAPKLVERAHLFGNRLALKDGTTCHDLPFFCAPAAASTATLDPLRQQLAARQGALPGDSASGNSAFGARLLRRRRSQQQQQLLPAVAAAGDNASQAVFADAGVASKPYVSGGRSPAGAADVSRGLGSAAASGTGVWWRRQNKWQQQQQQQSSALLGSTFGAADIGSTVIGSPKGVAAVEQSCVHLAPTAGLELVASPERAAATAAESSVTFVFCSVVNPRAK
jgi:hypothetical protein